MKNIRKHTHWIAFSILLVFSVIIWYAVAVGARASVLTVAFLAVGQGDAIFIEAPNGNQVLIDGGPNKTVLRAMGEVMPFYDRSLDMVIATHPDKDHIGGLPAVLEKFAVGMLVLSEVESDNGVYDATNDIAQNRGVDKVVARRGKRIVLDDGVYLDILSPDRNTAGWETNTASVVAKLVYGDTSFILTGDAPQAIENYLVSLDGKNLSASVLKLGHHGSRTSTSEFFLGVVDPQYAVISAGADNRYGHPHKEVTDMLTQFEIPSLSTAKHGTIIFRTDGENIKVQP